MAVRYYPGYMQAGGSSGFIIQGFTFNLEDGVTPTVANVPQRTTGQINIQAGEQVPIGSKWDLLSVSFQAFMLTNRAAGRAYGSLGQLGIGVILDTPIPVTGGQQAYATPPSDLSLFSQIWDGEIDNTPPDISVLTIPGDVSQAFSVSGTISPPIARTLYAGQEIAVGLWLTPSILASGQNGDAVSLFVLNAKYEIVVEDGKA